MLPVAITRSFNRLAPYLSMGALLCILACAPKVRFSVFRLYSNTEFTGGDLNGQRIMVTPLITRTGYESGGALTPGVVIEAAGKKRNDLRLVGPDDFTARFRARHGEDAIDRIYRDFFKGAMVSLQTNTVFWKELGSDYLMVLKLTYGLKTRTPDKRTIRQMRLEGELWECDSMEVVWRATVEGKCKGQPTTDTDMIVRAACKLFEALPAVAHGYGKGSW